jgi:catechol 2,3-dioxygenase
MAIPAPNLNPPFNIVRLSHTELRVTDLAWSRGFYVDTLGLQVTHEDSETIYLRAMEERGHHCMILKKAAQPSVGVLGFKVWSEEDLDKAEIWFRSRDLTTSWIERPFMGRVLSTRDPFRRSLEFYARMDRLEPIHQKYKLYRGVKPLRIDHFNLFSSNVDESVKFYGEIGFRVTEYTEDAITGRSWAAWMHRKGGVHDIAFTNGTGPRLHHTAFWVPTPLNIIDLLDLMSTTGYLSISSAAPAATASRTPSSSTSATRTATAPRSTARTTRPSIRITNRSSGTSRIRSARPCGVRPRRGAGLNWDPNSKAQTWWKAT